MLRNLLSPIFRLPRRKALPFVPVRALQVQAVQPLPAERPQRAVVTPRVANLPMRVATRYTNQFSS